MRSSLSRRRLLAGTAGLGGACLLAGAARHPAVGADATPAAGHGTHADPDGGADLLRPMAWASAELVEPDVRRSVAGELRTDLRVPLRL